MTTVRQDRAHERSDDTANKPGQAPDAYTGDALIFSSPTPGVVTVHPGSGIISTCFFGTQHDEWTTGSTEGLDFDTLLLTRGSNFPWHGELDGQVFSVSPHSRPLITYIPLGVNGKMTFYAEANTSSLLMFPPGRLVNMMHRGSEAATMPVVMSDNERLIDVFLLLERDIIQGEVGRPGNVETLTRMLAEYLTDHSVSKGTKKLQALAISPRKLKLVLDYIDANLAKPIDLAAMASAANQSIYHFIRMFKIATGKSPYRHLR